MTPAQPKRRRRTAYRSYFRSGLYSIQDCYRIAGSEAQAITSASRSLASYVTCTDTMA